MPTACALLLCPNHSTRKKSAENDAIKPKLHRMPTHDHVREKWASWIREVNGVEPNKTAMLCSEHFLSEYYLASGRLQLSAVPSLLARAEYRPSTPYTSNNVPLSEDPLALVSRNTLSHSPPTLCTETKSFKVGETDGRTLASSDRYVSSPVRCPSRDTDMEPDSVISNECRGDKTSIGSHGFIEFVSCGEYLPPGPSKSPKTPMTDKRKCYVGDLNTGDFNSPRKASRNLGVLKKKISLYQKLRANDLKRENQLKEKVKNLELIIKELQERQVVTNVVTDELRECRSVGVQCSDPFS